MLRYNKWMRMVSIVSFVAVFGFLLSLVGSAEAIQDTIDTTVNVETTLLVTCPWDLNRDGTVDKIDNEILLFCWGTCCGSCCSADFDSDGDVDVADFLELLANWGDCP